MGSFSTLPESGDQNHSGVFIFVTFRVLLFKIHASRKVNTFSFTLDVAKDSLSSIVTKEFSVKCCLFFNV